MKTNQERSGMDRQARGGGAVVPVPVRDGIYATLRRSQRIYLQVPVIVYGESANGIPFSEETTTLVVSAHGALIHLAEKVLPGQTVFLVHCKSSEEIACQVANVSRLGDGKAEVGIGFVTPSPNFWHVRFPPADWEMTTSGPRAGLSS